MGILNPLGLGVYKSPSNKERRQERRAEKMEDKRQNMVDTIDRLREKSKDKSNLSNFLSGRTRKISLFDMTEAERKRKAQLYK